MAEVPGPAQGQPAPEANVPPTETPFSPTKWAEQMDQATAISQQMPGAEGLAVGSTPPEGQAAAGPVIPTAPAMALHEGPDRWGPVIKQGGEGGLSEKPTDTFNRAYEKFFGPLSPEDRELLAKTAREYVKKSIGVTDTADLDPQAKKTFQAVWDWMTSKIQR